MHEPNKVSTIPGQERTMVPRDQGWFKIATIVMYFFPGSALSSLLS